jgi:ribosome-associated toxin RatA of RatAB toxin-antitoxin module
MHQLEPAGEDLLARARASSVAESEISVAADRLFATLEDGASWCQFFPVIRHAEWTSPRPFRQGTTRTVTLVGGVKLEEVFWTWEPGRRMGFAITASSNRMLKGLVETYDITPIGDRRCRLRWRMAMELNGPARFMEPHMGPLLLRTQTRLMKRLERVAQQFSPS